jgi:hypothetical protein
MLSLTNHQGSANQNHNEIISPHLEWLSSKKTKISNAGEEAEKAELFQTIGINVN